MFAGQTAKTLFGGHLQSNGTNINSNLNPFAKEFYPSSVKCRDIFLAEKKANLEIKRPELKTYEIMQGPAQEMAKVMSRFKGLMHVVHRPSLHLKTCASRHVRVLLKKSKIIKPELQKSLNNIEKNKKPLLISFGTKPSASVPSCKVPSASRRNVSSAMTLSPRRNVSSSRRQQATAAQEPKTAFSNVAIKSKVISKYVSPTKETPSKPPHKDCLSIRSGSSSVKSCSSVEASASQHFDVKKKEKKTILIRSSLQANGSSKTVRPVKSKVKTVAFTTPRGTVASSLRKTETQKRRNLFPFDPVLNIKMSEFLFK